MLPFAGGWERTIKVPYIGKVHTIEAPGQFISEGFSNAPARRLELYNAHANHDTTSTAVDAQSPREGRLRVVSIPQVSPDAHQTTTTRKRQKRFRHESSGSRIRNWLYLKPRSSTRHRCI